MKYSLEGCLLERRRTIKGLVIHYQFFFLQMHPNKGVELKEKQKHGDSK